MRARDLQKLRPGTKLWIKLAKVDIKADSMLNFWHNKTVYLENNTPEFFGCAALRVRSSKKVTNSTRCEHFYPKELSLVKD